MIGYVSVFPPVKSGIADYSFDIVNYLSKKEDILVFYDYQKPKDFPNAIYVGEIGKYYNKLDKIIYNIGNHEYHLKSYEMFLRYPSELILHDFNLHSLLFLFTAHKGYIKAYKKVLEQLYGDIDTNIMFSPLSSVEDKLNFMMKYNANEVVLDRAKKIFVHSLAVENILRQKGYNVEFLPQYYKDIQIENMKKDKKRIVVPGIISINKNVNQILDLADMLDNNWEIVFAGFPDNDDTRILLDKKCKNNCLYTGYLSQIHFREYIKSADIIVIPRKYNTGEMSGVLIISLGMGKITIASDIIGFNAFNDELFVKMSVNADAGEILSKIQEIEEDKDKYISMAEKAREYMLNNNSLNKVADILLKK